MFGWGRREKGGGYYHSAAAVGITGHAGLVDQDEIYSQVGDDHPWFKFGSKLGGDFRHGISGYLRYPVFWIPTLFLVVQFFLV